MRKNNLSNDFFERKSNMSNEGKNAILKVGSATAAGAVIGALGGSSGSAIGAGVGGVIGGVLVIVDTLKKK